MKIDLPSYIPAILAITNEAHSLGIINNGKLNHRQLNQILISKDPTFKPSFSKLQIGGTNNKYNQPNIWKTMKKLRPKTNQMLKKWYPNTLSDCCNICKIGIETKIHLTIYCDQRKIRKKIIRCALRCGRRTIRTSECG